MGKVSSSILLVGTKYISLLSSVEREHFPTKEGVTGSNPVGGSTQTNGWVSQEEENIPHKDECAASSAVPTTII
jgi:hypothetical protein